MPAATKSLRSLARRMGARYASIAGAGRYGHRLVSSTGNHLASKGEVAAAVVAFFSLPGESPGATSSSGEWSGGDAMVAD